MIRSLVGDRRLSIIISLGLAQFLFGLSTAAAQNAVAQEGALGSKESVEEITSYGRKSLLSFKVEMVAAEETYYDLYNRLNDDDAFDVICKKASPNGAKSRFARRICKARFEWEAISDNDRDRLQAGFFPQANQASVLRKKLMVLDKMEKLANENPELREALFSLTRISQEFAEEKKSRCEGHIFCNGDDAQ